MSKFTLSQLTMPKLSKKAVIGISALALTAVAGSADAAQRMDAMTRADVQTRSVEHFTKLDVNKDGKLDTADRAAHQTAMFDRLDGNKDGSVTRDEFAAARPGPDGERMGRRGDGPGEGRHGRHGGHGGGRMGGSEMMLGMADSNKDGAVSQAEFTAGALAMFDKADANKDGTVTRDERRAAHAAMRPAAAPVAPKPAAASAAPAT